MATGQYVGRSHGLNVGRALTALPYFAVFYILYIKTGPTALEVSAQGPVPSVRLYWQVQPPCRHGKFVCTVAARGRQIDHALPEAACIR